jgi:predicted nucleic acid-binding protein
MHILDASVFAPLVVMMGKRFLEISQKHHFIILDLTVYETCNAFWKEYRKFHRLSVEDVLEFCSVIKSLANKLNVYGFKDLDFGKVVDIAIDNNITVYDSAYIALALELHMPIASEDKDILNVGPRYNVVVMKLNELLGRL